jgi:glycine betaine/proline transport system substrate-binding protein
LLKKNAMTRKPPTMRQMFLPAIVLLIFLATILLPQGEQKTIRLHDDQIELQRVTNAITAFIIEEGYGYKIKLVEATIKEARPLLLRGDIDIALEVWVENNLLWHSQAIGEKLITDLGEMYSGGKQYWIVSKWYAEKHDIETVFDMKDHWQDFLDPDDPSKGLFFNCIYGWTCRDINRVKLQAYDLDKYYNTVSPLSPKSLKSIYENSQTRKFPIFGYYWEPNSIMEQKSWKILKEPPFSRETWIDVIEATSTQNGTRLENACSFNDSGAHKIVNSNLANKAPAIFKMLKKMKIDIVFFNEMFLNNEILEDNKLSPRQLALRYLKDYPEKWGLWVPPKVQKKVIKALQDYDPVETLGEKS